jgi:hypothetical protein
MEGQCMNRHSDKTTKTHGYAPVTGLKMYYEIERTGDPLVYIPVLTNNSSRLNRLHLAWDIKERRSRRRHTTNGKSTISSRRLPA